METGTARPDAKAELIAIDVLRLASAAAVAAYHFGTAFWLQPPVLAVAMLGAEPPRSAAVPFTWWGWIGVEIFFVISGFVIAFSAAASGAADFARRRFLRLAPGAWICATVTLAVVAAAGARPFTALAIQWFGAAFMTPFGPYIDGSYWTLAIEISFYLLVGLLLAFGLRSRIEFAARALGVLSALAWAAAALQAVSPILILSGRSMQLVLLSHGCFFALGVQLWAAVSHGATLKRMLWATLFYAACLVEIVAHTAERAASLHLGFSALVPILIFSLGVLVVACSARLQPVFGRAIAPARARLLGLMTYPLYLIHQMVGAVLLASLFGTLGAPLAIAVAAVAVAALTLVIVPLEKKLRAALSAGLSRPARPVLAAAAP